MDLKKILHILPEVKHPIEKKLSFNQKLKWTIIVLVAFFTLANIPLYGLTNNALQRFEYLALILGTEFGSVISLGIGPIVMASIILQLLVGSGILKIDTNSAEGKKYFQGIQKLGVLVFILLEAIIYVSMGGLAAVPGLAPLVIFQLVLGGLAVMFMDEVSSKWGLGSGVSIFIVAGVAWRLVSGLIQFVGTNGQICSLTDSANACSGSILIIISSFITGDTQGLLLAIAAIAATVIIFLGVVWAQSLKVEIPLTYEKLRGYGIKWPLAFFYASNIPVILAAALLANIQLLGTLLQNSVGHATFLGDFQSGQATSGLVYWLSHSNLVESLIRGTFSFNILLQAITHMIFFAGISALFAVLWVKTAGMDESSQAKKIIASGLQIPGFRKDQRVLESILKRYILPLTIMGGIAVGLLSSFADSLGALTSGTALLLSVMIMYQLYQNIAQQHAVDMHPSLRKFVS